MIGLGIVFCIGMILGIVFGFNAEPQSTSDPITDRLYDKLAAAEEEIAVLKRKNAELNNKSNDEEDWWKGGRPNPLGECSH